MSSGDSVPLHFAPKRAIDTRMLWWGTVLVGCADTRTLRACSRLVLALTILDPALAASKGTADKSRKAAQGDTIGEEARKARDKARRLRAEMLLQETLPKVGIESPTRQNGQCCYAYRNRKCKMSKKSFERYCSIHGPPCEVNDSGV
jgi:hypothetical protein